MIGGRGLGMRPTGIKAPLAMPTALPTFAEDDVSEVSDAAGCTTGFFNLTIPLNIVAPGDSSSGRSTLVSSTCIDSKEDLRTMVGFSSISVCGLIKNNVAISSVVYALAS
jgi:hypothetical protein